MELVGAEVVGIAGDYFLASVGTVFLVRHVDERICAVCGEKVKTKPALITVTLVFFQCFVVPLTAE